MRGPKDKEANERSGTADLWIRLSISEIAFSSSIGRSVSRWDDHHFQALFSHSCIYSTAGNIQNSEI